MTRAELEEQKAVTTATDREELTTLDEDGGSGMEDNEVISMSDGEEDHNLQGEDNTNSIAYWQDDETDDLDDDDQHAEKYLMSLVDHDVAIHLTAPDGAVHHSTAFATGRKRSADEISSDEVASVVSQDYVMTGRPSMMLYLSCDGRGQLTDYHVLLRKQIEFFEADPVEIHAAAQGRNKPIVLGQVGIRCLHCARVPPKERTKGAVYFPAKLDGVYQMAMGMAQSHFLATDGQACPNLPKSTRKQMFILRDQKQLVSGTGKHAWAARAGALGVYEDSCGLRYKPTIQG